MQNFSAQIVLQLLAKSICGIDATENTFISDWNEIAEIAEKHSIIPLILHASVMLPPEQKPPDNIIKVWKSYTISSTIRNERSMQAQAEAISILQSKGIACVVLKGTSVALLYPKPEMRALGDIDILVREDKCAQAVNALVADGYRKHETDHSFHIGFDKAGIYLELHYSMSQLPSSPIGDKINALIFNAVNRAKIESIDRYSFPVLSEPDQTLSLLLHMERHIVSGGIGLRQLCDWCVFMNSLSPIKLRDEVLPIIRECRLYQFASILTRACVDHLGLDETKHEWCMHIPRQTADALLNDIIDSGNLMSRDLERAASSTFIKGEENAAGKQSMFSSAARNLTQSARKQFPICNKLPILLPIYWVYIPIRYLYRSMKGTRPKQSIKKIAKYAMKRKRLYRNLELFKR